MHKEQNQVDPCTHNAHSLEEASDSNQIVTQVPVKFELDQATVERFVALWKHVLGKQT